MTEHTDYWQQLLRDGRGVVSDPSPTPKACGAWACYAPPTAPRCSRSGSRGPSIVVGVNTFEVFEIMGG